jgi:hypothetical protein
LIKKNLNNFEENTSGVSDFERIRPLKQIPHVTNGANKVLQHGKHHHRQQQQQQQHEKQS